MRKITEYLHAAAGRTLRRCHRSDASTSDTARRHRGAGDAAALPFKRKLLIEALEPRLLLSADLMPVTTVPVLTAAAQLPQAGLGPGQVALAGAGHLGGRLHRLPGQRRTRQGICSGRLRTGR